MILYRRYCSIPGLFFLRTSNEGGWGVWRAIARLWYLFKTMLSTSQKISRFLIAQRWPLFLAALLAGAVAYRTADVQFDHSIENMFASSDPLLPAYHKLKEEFGGNEVVLAVYEDPQLLDPSGEGIRRLERLSRELKEKPGVRDVLSLAEVSRSLEQVQRIGGLFGGRKFKGPAIVDPKSPLAARYRELFQGYTHSQDGNIAALVCLLEQQSQTSTPRRETIEALRDAVENPPKGLPAGMIAGEPVMVVEGFRYVEEDGDRLGWASTLLLALTIIICFRSLRWVVIAVAVVQLTLLLTRASLVWSGLKLSMVSSMLTAIVTVVGVATIVHVIVRFREARREGLSPVDSFARTVVLLAAPIFWACATDAVGFASLTVTQVGPVQDFGVMMAIGSLFVIVSVALLTPVLALSGKFDIDPRRVWGEGRLDNVLAGLIGWVEKRPRTLLTVLTAIVVLAVLGAARLEVETDFTKNFRSQSPIVQSYEFIETRLGGAGVWDVIIPAPEVLDEEYLQRVRRLEDRLRAIKTADDPGAAADLTKVISLADALEATKADSFLARLPISVRLAGMSRSMPAFIDALYNRGDDSGRPASLRIMLRAAERQGADQKKRLIQEVRRITLEEFGGDENGPAAETTGFFVLLTSLIESLIRDQWVAFAAASGGIALMMFIAFRSPALAFAALAPNALPIALVLGGMGWLGIRINMGAAMIAAVSMGLSVDSSIHYITSFRRSRLAGRSVTEALAESQQNVGRAMVFSTLALIVGFSTLCTSDFTPTVYFGALVGLTMLGGLLGNLLVLPLLLKLLVRES